MPDTNSEFQSTKEEFKRDGETHSINFGQAFQSTKEEFKHCFSIIYNEVCHSFNPPKRNLNEFQRDKSGAVVIVSIHQRGI